MPNTTRASVKKRTTQPNGKAKAPLTSSRKKSNHAPERDAPEKEARSASSPTVVSCQLPETIAALLSEKMIGVYTTRASRITLTNCGHSLREEGVDTSMQSIRDDGWVPTSYLIVALMNNGEERVLPRGGDSLKLDCRCLDGNHRLETLRRLDAGRGVDSEVDAIYRSLGTILAESAIANRLNDKTGMLVKMTLADRLSPYLKYINHLKGSKLTINELVRKIADKHERVRP